MKTSGVKPSRHTWGSWGCSLSEAGTWLSWRSWLSCRSQQVPPVACRRLIFWRSCAVSAWPQDNRASEADKERERDGKRDKDNETYIESYTKDARKIQRMTRFKQREREMDRETQILIDKHKDRHTAGVRHRVRQ